MGRHIFQPAVAPGRYNDTRAFGACPCARMEPLRLHRPDIAPARTMCRRAGGTHRFPSSVASSSRGQDGASTSASEARRLPPGHRNTSVDRPASGRADGWSTSAPLVEAIVHRAEQRHELPFHVPGHKRGSRLAPAQLAFIDEASWGRDTTELAGLDNLQNPEGVILQAMSLASGLWGCDHTWFLVNGATAGIHAAIMATCPDPGDCIIMARNAHQSAFHGAVLAGCRVRYVMPVCGDGIAHHVAVEGLEAAFQRAVDEKSTRVRAVLVVSPTYYGVQSDLVGLKAVCDRHGALLIVDEAHGAHLEFLHLVEGVGMPGRPRRRKGHSALSAGASLVVQSTHKQLGSLTQSSMLHGQGIDAALKTRIDRVLRMLQSSSPSYLLMASLDASRAALAAAIEAGDDDYIGGPHTAAMRIREYFGGFEGGRIPCDGCGMSLRLLDVAGAYAMDPWRLTVVVDCGGRGDEYVFKNGDSAGSALRKAPTGWSVARLLESARGVVAEMATQNAVVFACSIGTTEKHADGLIRAIEWLSNYVDEDDALQYHECGEKKYDTGDTYDDHGKGSWMSTCPRDAYTAPVVSMPLSLAANRVAAETITVYPPGIPVVCMGDVLTPATLSQIQLLKDVGASITGAADATMTTILVVRADDQ